MGHVIGFDTTYTGNPVSFNAANGGTMKSVSVPFSPTQDLHGYANPWPAGGGVNKYDKSADYYGQGKFWNSSTGALKSSADYYGSPKIPITPNTQYSRTAGTSANIFYDSNGDYLSTTFTGGTFTSPANAYYVTFNLANNVNHDTVQFEQGASLSAYSPYSNICPISGLTGLSVYRTGKNLFDPDSLETVTVNGVERFGHKYNGVGTYAIKAYATGNAGYVYARVLKTDGTWGSNIYVVANTTATAQTVTISAGQTLFVYNASAWTESASSELFNGWKVQVVLSSTQPDSYEPYKGNTYSVDWSTQAGTVYHGTVDVVTGLLTVDMAMVDLGTLNWNIYQTQFYAQLVDAKIPSYIEMPNAICSIFRPVAFVSLTSNDNAFAINSGQSRVNIVASAYSTPAEFKTAMSGVQFCYELATPITYQLTPKQIAALIGQNYIWSSNNETLTAVLTAPATGFAGWLIKCVTNGTPVEIPLKYMRAETYTVTPDQRMEWSAERDVTGVLHRETVQNLPPKIEFNTPLMTNSDINALNSIIKAAFTNYLQRNITIQFYDPERDQYWEWDCYMPDVKYQIRNADIVNSIINYEELRYAFIGY